MNNRNRITVEAQKYFNEKNVCIYHFDKFYPLDLNVKGTDLDGYDFFQGKPQEVAERFVSVILANCVEKINVEDREKKNFIQFKIKDNEYAYWSFKFSRLVSKTGETCFVVLLSYINKRKNKVTRIRRQMFPKYFNDQDCIYRRVQEQIKDVF